MVILLLKKSMLNSSYIFQSVILIKSILMQQCIIKNLFAELLRKSLIYQYLEFIFE